MKKGLWKASFSAVFIPEFPCPTCRNGILKKSKKEDLSSQRPRDPDFNDYEENPAAYPSRFSLFLRCNACAEVVLVIGSSIDVPEEDQDGNSEWFEYLEPEHMWPAPPILEIRGLPKPVQAQLKASFGFYWHDTGACASRIRTSMERLMDHFKIATTTLATHRDGTRYRKRLDLSARIDKFGSKAKRSEFKQILHALRKVGNVGTHGNRPITREAVLDAYKVYEFALDKLFEDKKESIGEIVKRLNKM